MKISENFWPEMCVNLYKLTPHFLSVRGELNYPTQGHHRSECPVHCLIRRFSLKRGLLTLLFHVARQLDCENTRLLFSKLAFLGDHLVLRWRVQGRGPGSPPPLFLDQTETRRPKNFLRPPPLLSLVSG